MEADMSKCLVPACERENLIIRGLCATHYRTADRLVKMGLTTWGDLEFNGKALAKRNRGLGEAAKWLLQNGDSE